ncbi:LysR family transcriptional regulator [Pseudaminobacter soli (ex Li et al. 2025)]|uniref:LysR family transcriptional regulator n=1 Tax=Pseudaminobacter soli (ex Li et al. 2025) TaxID=1295366 RepID=A0A2P7S3S8_9HYPH|nr:LysR family transcriptional regulator [Mesorhizobium soli]PSJ57138.1 LysR family transcriptional regulator [Mesorhizobium soli]
MSRSLIPAALHYFDRVASTGSIQAAARAQNIAASAIDRQIIGLEERLGVKLFDRMPKGMRLTAAGEVLVRLVHRWRAEERNAVAEILQLQGMQQGQVNVFAMDSHATTILPRLVQTIAAAHPLIGLSIQIGSTDEAVAALLSGRADLIIVFNLPQRSEVRPLWSLPLPFGCVVAPHHPLLARTDVKFQDVVTYPIALQSRSLLIRRFLEVQYSWLFAEPRGRVETNSLHLVKSLARSGNYVAFTSELDAATEIAQGMLCFLPLVEIDALPQSSDIAIDASKPLSTIVQIVADCAATVIEEVLDDARSGRD